VRRRDGATGPPRSGLSDMGGLTMAAGARLWCEFNAEAIGSSLHSFGAVPGSLLRVATPRELGLGLLHDLRWSSGASPAGELGVGRDREGRIEGAVGALVAVGLLSREDGAEWSSAFGSAPEAEPVRCLVDGTAERVLGELSDAVPSSAKEDAVEYSRFRGGLHALSDLRLVDREQWDDRLRSRLGWPSVAECVAERNSGGTEWELVAVLAGPPEFVDGIRVLFALRFRDGISFVAVRSRGRGSSLHRWRLRDDVGTDYRWGPGGASDRTQYQTCRTAPPDEAAWVELVSPPGNAIRVVL
jgi:hypothetical protein